MKRLIKLIAFRCGALMVGIMASLLILEIILRSAGSFLLFIQELNNKQNKINNIYTIICLGESTTYLGGNNSYPAQLERILNQENKGLNFKVYNKGIPGRGSTDILNESEQWLDQYKPNMAIIMMGINDGNSQIPVDEALHRKNPWLSELRIFKLFRWIWLNLEEHAKTKNKGLFIENEETKQKNAQLAIIAENMISQGKLQEAEKICLYLAQSKEPYARSFGRERLYNLYFKARRIDGVAKMLENDLNEDNTEHIVRNAIFQLCQNKETGLLATSLLSKRAKESKTKLIYYNLLQGCFSELGMTKEAEMFSVLANQEELSNVNPTTQSNYKRLLALLGNRKIKIICMQYPLRDIRSLKVMLQNEDQRSVIWVENKENFNEALRSHAFQEVFTDRFAGDFGHSTALGNNIIAKGVAQEILKGILDK